MEKKASIESSWVEPDVQLEKELRPKALCDFAGQQDIKERLHILISAAKNRKEPLSHLLFHGPPGLGKTTLAYIIAEEMGKKIVTSSGPALEKAGDLAGILTSLEEGDFFFIDEIHRLSRTVEEYLYSAMEDYTLDIMLDSGPSARTVQVKLNKFTLIAATTRMGSIAAPLRDRFGFNCRLEYYDEKTLEQIIKRSAEILLTSIDSGGICEIAKRSRGTPRIANHLLRWVRDFAESKGARNIEEQTTIQALDMLKIDRIGLDEMDRRYLRTILDHHEGGPVGIKTLAAALSEEESTLEEVHEPYLIKLGFVGFSPIHMGITQNRTPRRHSFVSKFTHLMPPVIGSQDMQGSGKLRGN